MSQNDGNPNTGEPQQQKHSIADAPTLPSLPEIPAQGPSRRAFLKAAVIGSAAVAAAGSAGAAALSVSGKTNIIRRLTNQASGEQCSGCVTGSSSNAADASNFNINCDGKAANPGDFYAWFTDSSLGPGNYILEAMVNGTDIGPSADFDFKGSGAVHQYNPAAPDPCPNMPTAPSPEIHTQADLTTAFSHPGGVFEVGLHVDYIGGTIGSVGATKLFTFTFTLSVVGDGTVCSSEAVITGTQTDQGNC